MCPARTAAIHALLPANAGAGFNAADHGQDRCSLPGGSLQRQTPDSGLPCHRLDPNLPRPPAKPLHCMGFWMINQKPRTTIPASPSERFRCLVDLSQGAAVDQVWATDITYISLQKECLYLVAIVDLFCSHLLNWRLSSSLDTEFCLAVIEMALRGCRKFDHFHPIRAACSRHLFSWPGCRLGRLRSARREGSAAMTTSSLNCCGGLSSMRMPNSVSITIAGRLRSALHASFGGFDV